MAHEKLNLEEEGVSVWREYDDNDTLLRAQHWSDMLNMTTIWESVGDIGHVRNIFGSNSRKMSE